MIDIFSFFSGAGFLDLGFEAEGFEVKFVNEIHQPFWDVYHYARTQMGIALPEYGGERQSIVDLIETKKNRRLQNLVQRSRRQGQLVGFIGGPPCPDFSVGGKNKGREGEKGILSEAYIQLICQQHPDFFLYENVKGLWRTQKHRVFYEELKDKLHRCGYVTTERLINAIEYGAPQDRDRIILLGFHKRLLKDMGIAIEAEHPSVMNGAFPWQASLCYQAKEVFNLPWVQSEPFEADSVRPFPNNVIREVTSQYWFDQNDVENHPNAEHYFQPKSIRRFESVPEGDDSKKSFKRLHRWRYSPTAAYGNNEVHLHPYKARRISASEALAIQSVPKAFVLPSDMSLTNMFKTIGNGVPYLAARGIARTILDFLGTSPYVRVDSSRPHRRN